MSYASKDVSYIPMKISAIEQSVNSFSAVIAEIAGLISELSGNTDGTVGGKLFGYANTIYNGTTQGWIADRTRYLSAVAPPEGTTIIASPLTKFFGISANFPTGNYGARSSYSADLKGWNIVTLVSSAALGVSVSATESIDAYCGYGSRVLSAKTAANAIYTQDVYNFCIQNNQYSFVCKYLWETPAMALTANRQCNGLYSAFSALSGTGAYQTNQITFEDDKQSFLGSLV